MILSPSRTRYSSADGVQSRDQLLQQGSGERSRTKKLRNVYQTSLHLLVGFGRLVTRLCRLRMRAANVSRPEVISTFHSNRASMRTRDPVTHLSSPGCRVSGRTSNTTAKKRCNNNSLLPIAKGCKFIVQNKHPTTVYPGNKVMLQVSITGDNWKIQWPREMLQVSITGVKFILTLSK